METFSRHVEIKHEILLLEADLARDTSCLRCSQNRLRGSDLATTQYARIYFTTVIKVCRLSVF